MHSLNADSLWADVLAVRQQQPLVHNITNFVVMNYNANALLALGAAPVMAHAREEVRDMVGIAQALVLNIGTLSPEWIEAMIMALQTARGRGIPVVLDPVGAGATSYRNRAVAELLAAGSPTVLRGNASEILSVAGVEAATRGVDSAAASDDAVQTARTLAARLAQLLFNEIGEPDRRQILVHLEIQRRPQFVGHAALFVFAILTAAALRGIERLVDRTDDVRHGDLIRGSGQAITAAGTTHAVDNIEATQLAEQLLEIRE